MHLRQATLVEQVDDELQFVQHFVIGYFRLVARLDENFEALHDEMSGATAKHSLLAEQVGLGLFSEGGLKDTATRAADAVRVSQSH